MTTRDIIRLCLVKIIVYLLASECLGRAIGSSSGGHYSPFMFLCQFHQRPQNELGDVMLGDQHSRDVELSVTVDGHPSFYKPGEMYRVIVSSSTNFDGFLMTGLYTRLYNSEGEADKLSDFQSAGNSGLVCSVVHSHVSQRPHKSLTFLWIAPNHAGCVDFLSTGTLGQRIIFKDVLVFQFCDKISFSTFQKERYSLRSFEENGVVLREDFENVASNNSLWQSKVGVEFKNVVGHPSHNDMAFFCQVIGDRILESIPLNASVSTVLQFSVVTNNCQVSDQKVPNDVTVAVHVDLYVGLENCTSWINLLSFSTPNSCDVAVHLVPLPASVRVSDVCFRWVQRAPGNSSCWGLDDIVLSNSSSVPPSFLWEQFDPVDPGNWLFFPGGRIGRHCRSEGNALVFTSRQTSSAISYVTTRGLRVATDTDVKSLEASAIYREDFDDVNTASADWRIVGGKIGQSCGIVDHKKAVVMSGWLEGSDQVGSSMNETMVCSPFVNATKATILSFYLSTGCGDVLKHVNDELKLSNYWINVFAEFPDGRSIFLKNVSQLKFQHPHRVVIPLPSKCRASKVRFCLNETVVATASSTPTSTNRSEGMSWAVDSFLLLPEWTPSNVTQHVIQFKLGFQCLTSALPTFKLNTSFVLIDFSIDQGLSWSPLHTPCLPPACKGRQSSLDSRLWLQDYTAWRRVTFPLPLAALLAPTSFRFQQTGNSQKGLSWAIDDVFIGKCVEGCRGHGQCSTTGCRCDPGYESHICQTTLVSHPQNLYHDFSSETSLLDKQNEVKVTGASVGYQCGVLDRNKALVFSGEDRRCITTAELNTSAARFIEFVLRIGNLEPNGSCPPPDSSTEGVYVHSTCDGGVSWLLLEHFLPLPKFILPSHVTISLPVQSKGSSCQFRIWQAEHSGASLDVWAIDSLSVGSALLNAITVDFQNELSVSSAFVVSAGVVAPHCGSDGAIRFSKSNVSGDVEHFLETKSVSVGSHHMLQFELSFGCGNESGQNDYQVSLDYTKDHGLSWHRVSSSCLPTSPDCGGRYHFGTVYHSSEYGSWKRITVALPPLTWSGATRFRLHPESYTNYSATWAVDNFYVGPACSDLCNGHGWCVDGSCRCDLGFSGTNCLPVEKLSDHLKIIATSVRELGDNGIQISGGDVITIDASESAVHFYKGGIRQLVTPDLDTMEAESVQFYLQTLTNPDRSINNSEIVLQFSNDAGVTWQLLKELMWSHYVDPRFEWACLPSLARTKCTRVRFWQPNLSTENWDRWVVDKIDIRPQEQLRSLQMDKNVTADSIFAFHTHATVRSYCLSEDLVLVFEGMERSRFVITKQIYLQEGDVLQFKISVGCTDTFSWIGAVRLDFSHDGGQSWSLVRNACYPGMRCALFQESSVYYSGMHGRWFLVVIAITKQIASRKTIFRWSQKMLANESIVAGSFGLTDVYVGKPCASWCSGRGICSSGVCICDKDFEESNCSPTTDNPSHMSDNFDSEYSEDVTHWKFVHGGAIDPSHDSPGVGNSLFFGGMGFREARTLELDSRNIGTIRFLLRLDFHKASLQSQRHNESVILQYSVNNGLSWAPLHHFDVFCDPSPTSPAYYYTVRLPLPAQSSSTTFRWWQPLDSQSSFEIGDERATWALDAVEIGEVRDVPADGMWEDFSAFDPSHWFTINGGGIRSACEGEGNVLYFNKSKDAQFAETFDFEVTSADFLQFRLILDCHGSRQAPDPIEFDGPDKRSRLSISVEYSVDRRHSWHLLRDDCSPTDVGCYNYQLASVYDDHETSRWSRVSILLPARAVSPRTRFRWRKTFDQVSAEPSSWALDDIYLGSNCSWLCSGHGTCRDGQCVCDEHFGGAHCVSETQLAHELRESFDNPIAGSIWWSELRGGTVGQACGVVGAGSALVFADGGPRSATTTDLDLSRAAEIQFDIRFGCVAPVTNVSLPDAESRRRNAVVVQCSNNGGISWHLLAELPFKPEGGRAKCLINLLDHPTVLTNATRLRFWQPNSKGVSPFHQSWAIDNLFVGGDATPLNVLLDDFDDDAGEEPLPHLWIGWSCGTVTSYCSSSVEHQKVLMFRQDVPGERSAHTRDVEMGVGNVMQFDINVGCGSSPTGQHPVMLEYSINRGRSWQLLREPFDGDYSYSVTSLDVASVFHANGLATWSRVTILLDHLRFFGMVRFRWSQGQLDATDGAASWGIDNVYVGPACEKRCSNHGNCRRGLVCHCDTGYGESDCSVGLVALPRIIREDFELVERDGRGTTGGRDELTVHSPWLFWSGAEISEGCGTLFSGMSLYFNRPGDRLLISREHDLSAASELSFYLGMGCPSGETRSVALNYPVLLHYTRDGGVTWHLVADFLLSSLIINVSKPIVRRVVLEWPEEARTTGVQLRWWHPTDDGLFANDWAIDQIVIGSSRNVELVNDDFLSDQGLSSWSTMSGVVSQPACGHRNNTLHFARGPDHRLAETVDLNLVGKAFVQFELSMGCSDLLRCYVVKLDYSLDGGRQWELLFAGCPPSERQCLAHQEPSMFASDVYERPTLVTLLVPDYAMSKTTRFRWSQTDGFDSRDTWALGFVYIGGECADACGGRGRCHEGRCTCREGWTGPACDRPDASLLTGFHDQFLDGVRSERWRLVRGAVVSTICGSVGSETALHFYGGCSRLAETVAMDLRNSLIVRFGFRFGCLQLPTNLNQSVLLQYSFNGGLDWSTLYILRHDQHATAESPVIIVLPPESRTVGISLRWWQPQHNGPGAGDWSLYAITIGHGLAVEHSPPNGTLRLDTAWVQRSNIRFVNFCGSDQPVLVGKSSSDQNSFVETGDVDVNHEYVLEFKIAVGCDWKEDVGKECSTPTAVVRLEWSLDQGLSWSPVVEAREPRSGLGTDNGGDIGSLYEAPTRWRRVLLELHMNGTVRFRWMQRTHHESPEWGLQDSYVGPPCTNRWTCDSTFSWNDWSENKFPQTHLYDGFEELDLNHSVWNLNLGGSVKIMPGASSALVFDDCGTRLLETVDLDLRLAKFLKFVFAGASFSKARHDGSCAEDGHVYVQYSTNFGISWSTLNQLDVVAGVNIPSRSEHLALPGEARKANTRFRWWQMRPSSSANCSRSSSSSWAIDDVAIGGSDVNPDGLYETFESGVARADIWWPQSAGKVQNSFCGTNISNSFVANNLPEKLGNSENPVFGLTTRELIIGENYVLQFKLAIGCDNDLNRLCNGEKPSSIVLEYTTYPSSRDNWEMLIAPCRASSLTTDSCSHHRFGQPTLYSSVMLLGFTRISLQIPEYAMSSRTQFRWRPVAPLLASLRWAVDDIFIGEGCHQACSGRGDCTATGSCHCDEDATGESCWSVPGAIKPDSLFDSFEQRIDLGKWKSVVGGHVSSDCGILFPWARGNHLHFDGSCGLRQALTLDMDLTQTGKIIFVLRIGSLFNGSKCSSDPSQLQEIHGIATVLLQFSLDNGMHWETLASHYSQDFLQPRKLMYNIPREAQQLGVQIRWWQPYHDGFPSDHWSIDNVEFVKLSYSSRIRTPFQNGDRY